MPLSVKDVDVPAFQVREWRVQRAGWGVLALVVIAALLGLFGAGPLSETTTEADDGTVQVEYERFLRHIGTSRMTISVGDAAFEKGMARVYISRELVEGWRLESVSPAPSTASSSDEWLIWQFDVLGESAPVIKVEIRGDGVGKNSGVIRAGDGEPVSLTQWIYP